ncbi:hypothetical protein HDU87_007852 [Geranomyces variabilis]|uniref:UDP-N-acetylglucosamine transferase subunit ALG13 n=1 Tax=Geranomyces variabilis TaxID=109894 RepID=A0AAD5TE60_9FUNG|nr:hypothetical protein HDU87_007852 [Geranomyces variabilis]
MLTAMDYPSLLVSAPLNIAFYVTGHGFGHATRAHVTIRRLLSLGHHVTITSSVPSFIFRDLLSRHSNTCELREVGTLDPGVVQRDAVTVDVEVTMERLSAFLDGMDTVARKEVEWLKSQSFDVVCLDAPFLPARVAKEANVPSILITNFTFDAIFAAIAETPSDHALVARCAALYAHADYLIRLPGHIPIPSFPTLSPQYTLDVPLIVRMAQQPRAVVRAALGVPLDAKCVLITFGGFELGNAGDGHAIEDVLPPGWCGLVGGQTDDKGVLGDRLRRIRTEKHHMPDLIHAADVVVGKCGYGTCSEVVAHGVPLVYVPRSGFAEEVGLVDNLMTVHGYAVQMPQGDFYAGRWQDYILRAEALKGTKTPQPIANDGEIAAANFVVSVGARRRHAASVGAE